MYTGCIYVMRCRLCFLVIAVFMIGAIAGSAASAQLIAPPPPVMSSADAQGVFTEQDRKALRRIDLVCRKLNAKFFPYQSEQRLLDEAPQ